MNKFFCIFLILLFISKTENVFSNNLIYDVNNVEVKGKINNSSAKNKLIESAFKKAFIIFVNKTLLKEDSVALYKTKIETIKNLILTYQIAGNTRNAMNNNTVIFNIKFDAKKINNFLASRGISYADISNISLTLLPILVQDKNILLYEENFFYKNWLTPMDTTVNIDEELIKYNLALENIEDLEYINITKDNLNLIDIKKLNSFNENKNYVLLILYSSDKQFKAFIKTFIKKKSIDRNIDLNFDNNKKLYEKSIVILKKEINQIWKSQNLIDVNTPSFLDFFLETKEVNDYLKLKSILDTIDIIEKYSVLEMTNKYSKIRIKYKGKVGKIQNKLSDKKIDIKIVDNIWRLKII
ncbi:hypothetical protein OAB59_00050 [Pelagibacteraceae bacterium]|nr:hypothetical protein [Pelagibacteraceae bacterium]